MVEVFLSLLVDYVWSVMFNLINMALNKTFFNGHGNLDC